jgi:hypothetical protein
VLQSIQVPVHLPPNHRGYEITHLSVSSLNKFRTCPDDWRRHYLLGERGPQSGYLIIGNRVDDALSAYFKEMMAGTKLDQEQVVDAFNDIWKVKLAEEAERGPIDWSDNGSAEEAFNLGRQAVEVAYTGLVPRIGRPLAVQRKIDFSIHPDVAWTILGYVDLDCEREVTIYVDLETGSEYAVVDLGDAEPTVEFPYIEAPEHLRPPVEDRTGLLKPDEAIAKFERDHAVYLERRATWEDNPERTGTGPRAPKALPEISIPLRELGGYEITEQTHRGIVDYKVKNWPIDARKAKGDTQATIYLAEARLYQGLDVRDFRFAQVAKPTEKGRKSLGTSLVRTTRSVEQLQQMLVHIQMVAQQIDTLYRTLGPNRPWGFAAPEAAGWKCSERFCTHFNTCPVGRLQTSS